MEYHPQIIALDLDGLAMVSACSAGAKIKVADIKYLSINKVVLLSIERKKIETAQKNKRICSILRFDHVLKVKSKNINQKNIDYNKAELQRKKFRHYYNKFLLSRRISADRKMLLKLNNTKLNLSFR